MIPGGIGVSLHIEGSVETREQARRAMAFPPPAISGLNTRNVFLFEPGGEK